METAVLPRGRQQDILLQGPVCLTGTRVSNAAAILSCTHNDNDLLGNSNCVSNTKSTTYKVYIPPAEHVHRYYILQHYVMDSWFSIA